MRRMPGAPRGPRPSRRRVAIRRCARLRDTFCRRSCHGSPPPHQRRTSPTRRRRPRESRGGGCPGARGARRRSSAPPAGAAEPPHQILVRLRLGGFFAEPLRSTSWSSCSARNSISRCRWPISYRRSWMLLLTAMWSTPGRQDHDVDHHPSRRNPSCRSVHGHPASSRVVVRGLPTTGPSAAPPTPQREGREGTPNAHADEPLQRPPAVARRRVRGTRGRPRGRLRPIGAYGSVNLAAFTAVGSICLSGWWLRPGGESLPHSAAPRSTEPSCRAATALRGRGEGGYRRRPATLEQLRTPGCLSALSRGAAVSGLAVSGSDVLTLHAGRARHALGRSAPTGRPNHR